MPVTTPSQQQLQAARTSADWRLVNSTVTVIVTVIAMWDFGVASVGRSWAGGRCGWVGCGYYFVVTLRRDGALVVHSSWRVVVLRFYMCCLATGVSLWL